MAPFGGPSTMDEILEELATGGAGAVDLADLLVIIGDPKAVPLLKPMLDCGRFDAYSLTSPQAQLGSGCSSCLVSG